MKSSLFRLAAWMVPSIVPALGASASAWAVFEVGGTTPLLLLGAFLFCWIISIGFSKSLLNVMSTTDILVSSDRMMREHIGRIMTFSHRQFDHLPRDLDEALRTMIERRDVHRATILIAMTDCLDMMARHADRPGSEILIRHLGIVFMTIAGRQSTDVVRRLLTETPSASAAMRAGVAAFGGMEGFAIYGSNAIGKIVRDYYDSLPANAA